MGFVDVSHSLGRMGQPRMQARCSTCARQEVFACNRNDFGRARKKIQAMGWSLIGGSLRCPICEAKRKAHIVKKQQGSRKTTPGGTARKPQTVNQPAPAPLRQPTPAQRREIVALLQEVYDAEAECYQRGDTDATLAEVLNVMPGWVAQIRTDFFGPAGGNQEMAELAAELRDFGVAVREALQGLAAQEAALQALHKQHSAQARRLEAIQRAVGDHVLARAS